jgi:hypothetical protein
VCVQDHLPDVGRPDLLSRLRSIRAYACVSWKPNTVVAPV